MRIIIIIKNLLRWNVLAFLEHAAVNRRVVGSSPTGGVRVQNA